MKIIRLIALIGSFLCLPVKAQDLVIVGDAYHPPYAYLEDNHVKGIYADIIRETIALMPDYTPKIELYPWKRALKRVQQNDAHALFPPYYFPDKRPYLSLYSDPILVEEAVVFCNKHAFAKQNLDIPIHSQWETELSVMRFVVSRGVQMGGDKFWQNVKKGVIKVIEVEGPKAALNMLARGRADCHMVIPPKINGPQK